MGRGWGVKGASDGGRVKHARHVGQRAAWTVESALACRRSHTGP